MNIHALLSTQRPSFPQLQEGMQKVLAAPAAAGLVDAEADRELKKKLLEKSLSVAIALEQATIPPYLCALWSIKDELHPVAKSIREILQEEMLHMSLVCNMLSAIGGTPDLPANCVNYPDALPGGVHPGLEVKLAGLSDAILNDFMVIERPEHIVEHGHDIVVTPDGPTIGSFYVSLEALFRDVNPSFNTENQISGLIAKLVITQLSDVSAAIAMIREQGEGSVSSPIDTGLDDLAHYYRFDEILQRKRIEYDETRDTGFFHGAELAFPEVLPMQAVPKGGYQQKDMPAEAWDLIERFDQAYSQMLRYLNSAWTGGGQGAFLKSIEYMFELEKTAKPLMQMPVPGVPGKTLGPCFRYIPEQQTSSN